MEKIIKISNLLRIPVERIVTLPKYIEIISGNQNVGSLPYTTVANINTYDTAVQVLNNFSWNHIYLKNEKEINYLIYEVLKQKEDDIQITIGDFRKLYIKDNEDNLTCVITCSYLNGNWAIEK